MMMTARIQEVIQKLARLSSFVLFWSTVLLQVQVRSFAYAWTTTRPAAAAAVSSPRPASRQPFAAFTAATTTTTTTTTFHRQAPTRPLLFISKGQQQQSLSSTSLQSNIFFGPEEEFECPDEEECEIDWDAMPGFGPDDTSNENDDGNGGERKNNVQYDMLLLEDEMDIDLQPRPSFGPSSSSLSSSSSVDTATAALHMEMNWQMDECTTEQEACSDFCQDCAGSGIQTCKFCRGTKVIAFGGEFKPCLLCHDDGHVECPTCRGTGQISPWAKMHNEHMTNTRNNNNLSSGHRH